MNESIKKIINQFDKLAEGGKLEVDVQEAIDSRNKYKQPLEYFAHIANSLLTVKEKEFIKSEKFMSKYACIFVSSYKAASKKDKEIADAYLLSLIEDHPFKDDTALAVQVMNLFEAEISRKEVAFSRNKALVWSQYKSLIQYSNEFINRLLGFLIPCIQLTLGKQISKNVFNQSYQAKLDQLKSITGKKQTLFHEIFEIASPALRNAVVHGRAWLDSDSRVVRYTVGKNNAIEKKIEILQLMMMAHLTVDLVKAYLASISSLLILIEKDPVFIDLLPDSIVSTFNNS